MRRARGSRSLPLAAACLTACSASCVSAYRPPTPDDPHATVKVRRVYETTPGTQLSESCSVNGHPAMQASVSSQEAAAPRTDAFLVHPRAAKLTFRGGFSHQEMRTVQESYTVSTPYSASESYSCGSGTTFRTCTRSVTRYRTETKYRWVTKNVPVGNGSCSKDLFLEPAADQIYLVTFTYQDNGVCAAACVEQTVIRADGSFESRPCPQPPAEEIREITEEDPEAKGNAAPSSRATSSEEP